MWIALVFVGLYSGEFIWFIGAVSMYVGCKYNECVTETCCISLIPKFLASGIEHDTLQPSGMNLGGAVWNLTVFNGAAC